jgi:hypothetical protein
MKATFLFTMLCFFWINVFAQAPQSFKYQAVVRDNSGSIIANKPVSFRISILNGSAIGTAVYREIHTGTSTNAFGLVDLEIGKGASESGTFSNINWASGNYFVRVEIFPSGAAAWQEMGTMQLLSVPYALYAKDVQNKDDADADPANEIQTLSVAGNNLSLSKGGGTVAIPADNWGNQFAKTNATLTGQGTDASPLGVVSSEIKPVWGNIVSIPAGFADGVDNVNDADADTTNEIQKLSLSGTQLTLSKNGGTVTLLSTGGGDNWGTDVAKTDATLAGNGTTATPLKIAQQSATNGQVLKWDGLTWKPAKDNFNDADTSITNELQTLSLSGTLLTLSKDGGTVTLPSSGGGDNWGSQTVIPDKTLEGNGTVASPLKIADNGVTSAKIANETIGTDDLADNVVTSGKLAYSSVISAKIAAGAVSGDKIAQAGATNGQALKWNGTTWAPAADATADGGWTDDGTIVRLTTTTDTVQIGSVKRLGKFNVGGDIGLNLLNSIYFGSDATRISSLTGGDLRFVAEDLSMLTTEDITFGHYGDETWIKFDNVNKRVGIGSLSPTDRLHVVQNVATAGLSAIKGVATPTTVSNNGVYGESMSSTGYGLYGKSPKYGVYGTATGSQGRGVVGEATGSASIGIQGLATNTSSTGVWGEGSSQGVYGKSDLATGKGIFGQVTSATGYSGYFDGGKFYVSGNTGIGTTTPTKKLHVYGSAQIKDTLYANVVNAAKISNMPGLANSIVGSPDTYHSLATSWAELNSVTINVPAPGYVLLFASCELLSDHAYNDATAVYLGISKTSNGAGIKHIAHWKVNILTGSDFISEFISAQTPIQVTSAGSQTFYLMGYRRGGDHTDGVFMHQCNLTALFIPVAYGTVE